MDYPIVNISGSEDWQNAYTIGQALEWLYPRQGGGDLAYALCYNDGPTGVSKESEVTGLEMVQEGERDGGSWIWKVTFPEGTWTVTGWCDYTGWDCQSGLEWVKE